MKKPKRNTRIYHEKYGLGTIKKSFGDNLSVVEFDTPHLQSKDSIENNNKLFEVKFKHEEETFKYVCPGCGRFAEYTGTHDKCIKWIQVMSGTLCPYCMPKKED